MNGTAAVRNSLPDSQSTLAPLVRLSARVGRDPLLVQASSGNTSIKLEGVLWIKASGEWGKIYENNLTKTTGVPVPSQTPPADWREVYKMQPPGA